MLSMLPPSPQLFLLPQLLESNLATSLERMNSVATIVLRLHQIQITLYKDMALRPHKNK